jgi:hypothetical protein
MHVIDQVRYFVAPHTLLPSREGSREDHMASLKSDSSSLRYVFSEDESAISPDRRYL